MCGRAAAEHTSILVPDVEAFPGHIACDAESRSEVVVPIMAPCVRNVGTRAGAGAESEGSGDVVGEGRGRLVGVIDVDCAAVRGFDEEDVRWLEEVAGVLGRGCDWGVI